MATFSNFTQSLTSGCIAVDFPQQRASNAENVNAVMPAAQVKFSTYRELYIRFTLCCVLLWFSIGYVQQPFRSTSLDPGQLCDFTSDNGSPKKNMDIHPNPPEVFIDNKTQIKQTKSLWPVSLDEKVWS